MLADPGIGGYAVDVRRNAAEPKATRAIEDFFASADPDDLLVLYVSGHGVKDDDGRLYLAMRDSRHDRLGATTVPAQFIRDQMRRSRARRIVVWLDCCYAGAFPVGLRHRAAEQAGVLEQFRGGGYAVMTSSSALEYAYEPTAGAVTAMRSAQPSVFTAVLTDGLRTGDADLDGDGRIDIDELYEYLYDRVRAATPGQTPQKISDLDGKLYVAHSVRGPRPEAVLTAGVVQALRSPEEEIRATAVAPLASLAASGDPAVAAAARTALAELAVGTGAPAERAREALRSMDRSAGTETRQRPRRRRRRFLLGAALASLAAGAAVAVILLSQPSYALEPVATLAVPAGSDSIAFSPDGHVLASGDGDGFIRLWNVADPARAAVTARLQATSSSRFPDNVASVAFSSDGHLLASADADGLVRLWDTTDPARATLTGQFQVANPAKLPFDALKAVVFSPGGHILASGDDNGTVGLWNVTHTAYPTAIGSPLLNGRGDASVSSVEFSSDGRLLASGNSGVSGDPIQLWNVADPAHPVMLGPPAGSGGPVPVPGNAFPVAFRPGGHILAAPDGGTDSVRLWNVSGQGPATPSGPPLSMGRNQHEYVDSLAFSPDGHILTSGDSAGTIRLWNVSDPVHPVLMDQPVGPASGTTIDAVAFSPDGTILAANDHGIRLWRVPPVR